MKQRGLKTAWLGTTVLLTPLWSERRASSTVPAGSATSTAASCPTASNALRTCTQPIHKKTTEGQVNLSGQSQVAKHTENRGMGMLKGSTTSKWLCLRTACTMKARRGLERDPRKQQQQSLSRTAGERVKSLNWWRKDDFSGKHGGKHCVTGYGTGAQLCVTSWNQESPNSGEQSRSVNREAGIRKHSFTSSKTPFSMPEVCLRRRGLGSSRSPHKHKKAHEGTAPLAHKGMSMPSRPWFQIRHNTTQVDRGQASGTKSCISTKHYTLQDI